MADVYPDYQMMLPTDCMRHIFESLLSGSNAELHNNNFISTTKCDSGKYVTANILIRKAKEKIHYKMKQGKWKKTDPRIPRSLLKPRG